MTISQMLEFAEKALRPGLLGLAGQVKERQCARELKTYFKSLGLELKKLKLEELANHASPTDDMIRHAVEMVIGNTLKRSSTLLQSILQHHLAGAYALASKMDYLKEADSKKPPLDKLGPSGQSAADWANENAAQLVTSINKTTLDTIADAVSEGIKDQLGVPGTSRLIRSAVDNMSKVRADMIATTEMNRAMSTAALDKMNQKGIEYKQIILAGDACDICESCSDEDPIPVDQSYNTGDDGPPFHPNCRCTVTGARAPDDDE